MADKLVIVVPCFNEEEVLHETTKQLSKVITDLVAQGEIADDSCILYVNDGSRDATWLIIEELHHQNKFVCGVNLAGNVGHQRALTAGLTVAKDIGDMIVSIDADLQDDVNVIPKMVENYHQGDDIVYGVRKERKTDTWFKRNTALLFYTLMKKLGVDSVYNHADFRLMSKRAVAQLCQYHEKNLFLRGLVPLIGYRSSCVYYDRAERFAGESKYPLSKMLNFAIDGITSFSVRPVRLILLLGLLFIFVALIISIYVLNSLIKGYSSQGWASLMLSLWFIGGCLLIGLGVVGEYIGKIYIEVKNRPLYNIEKVLLKEETKKE